jgi:hypothetical protein
MCSVIIVSPCIPTGSQIISAGVTVLMKTRCKLLYANMFTLFGINLRIPSSEILVDFTRARHL